MKSRLFAAFLLSAVVGVAQQSSTHFAKLSVPGVKGTLQLDVGPVEFQTRVRPDGKEAQLRAIGRQDGLEITAFLQRVDFAASPERCRTEWWAGTKNIPFQRDDLQESATDEIARVEYIIPEFRGAKVRQKNIHAYLGENNLCAEIHLSKAGFTQQEQELFEQVLASARLIAESGAEEATDTSTSAPDNSAKYYFGEGSGLYLQQNYSGAAEIYQKALDLEKQMRTLSPTYFRVLVDNLGMAYGISGKLAQAKATFQYGMTQDPEYPLFYYNMACAYGEEGNMQEAISQLRLAYKYKANVIQGESIPDPLKDDSFRYFVDNKKFTDALRDMQK